MRDVTKQLDDQPGDTQVPDKQRREAQAHKQEPNTPEALPPPERDTPKHSIHAKDSQRPHQILPLAEHLGPAVASQRAPSSEPQKSQWCLPVPMGRSVRSTWWLCAPCQGALSLRVEVPPGDPAPAGTTRGGAGSDKCAEALREKALQEGQGARGPQHEVNTEQASKMLMRKPTRHNNGEGHSMGTREYRASQDSAGLVVAALAQRESVQQGNSEKVVRRDKSTSTLVPLGPGAAYAEDEWVRSTCEAG